MKSIGILYFAMLREQRGLAEEQVQTAARTPRDLYAGLQAAHSFTLEPSRLRVIINDEFADWDVPLTDGDRVVFVPPVAGG
ncbi:MAG: MoaD/ThiS family protein [Candidatus Hydrogenedentes bacterium]|nr:MoaD/ThiS family protein [Candidatus Hydrogenedentota bacterium]